MTPAEVRGCSTWEFSAAVNGWIAANVPEEQGKLSVEDEDALWKGVMERMH